MAMGGAAAKKDGAATVAKTKSMPTEDDCFGAGSIHAEGRDHACGPGLPPDGGRRVQPRNLR